MTVTEPRVSSRLLDSGDQSVVEVLGSMADDELRPTRGGQLLLDVDRPLASFGGHEGARRCDVVGLIDDVVVGHGMARIVEVGGYRIAQIDDLYVHPDARGVGVGAAMLDQIRSWATSERCTQLESQVLPGNREAKNFFERMGMVTRRMNVSTPL